MVFQSVYLSFMIRIEFPPKSLSVVSIVPRIYIQAKGRKKGEHAQSIICHLTICEAHLDNDVSDIGRIVDAKYAANNAISSI